MTAQRFFFTFLKYTDTNTFVSVYFKHIYIYDNIGKGLVMVLTSDATTYYYLAMRCILALKCVISLQPTTHGQGALGKRYRLTGTSNGLGGTQACQMGSITLFEFSSYNIKRIVSF